MTEFEPFPKIARLNRDIIITEKIDGTNAQVYVRAHPCLNPTLENTASWVSDVKRVLHDGMIYTIRAGMVCPDRYIRPVW